MVYICRAQGVGVGALPPSCGTDRQYHCENKQMDLWRCRPVWLTPGLSPRPLIPRCLWSLCCCLATGSIFLSTGPSGRSCLWLVYRRQSRARAPGGSDSPGSSFLLCSAWQPWELLGWGAGQPVALGALLCRERHPQKKPG